MNIRKKAVSSLALLALALAGASMAHAAQPSVRIGYQLPLTGNTAQYGQDFKAAAEIALKEFNASGRIPVPVEIVFEDSRSDAKEAVSIARKFADDPSIVGVLGDFTSTVSMASAQVYKRAGLSQLSQTASHPDYTKISKWQFRNITNQDQEGPFNADWIASQGFKKVAVIGEQTDWGQSAVQAFEKKAKENGIEVVFSEYFNRGIPDFRSLITKVDRVHPDAIYGAIFYEDAAQFLKQLHQLGVKAPVFSSSAAYNEQLIKLAGKDADGLRLTSTFLPTVDAENVRHFVTAWKAVRNGEEPGQFPAQAYDATNIMLAAVARTYPDATRDKVRQALAETKDFPGVTGSTTFDADREPHKSLVKVEVVNGKFEPSAH
ncbi:penicillin-binding protein activator [Pseudomonas sp. TH05]|uniref:ABC transporter substrate-binding protein n=1 Tax=unclassified Pseudomonas TaxID=196821 RepID=UPI00191423CC|nr:MULTISPECIES: ABC transporter substrate-binding protein [unclassified Pseudomonas]MBK5539522.1 penicillin-binding protein activator [Pseudomonas sp. TH07]MBK5554935.1 penicillin-binding protein activator [Pseudomonas sp. TH05]